MDRPTYRASFCRLWVISVVLYNIRCAPRVQTKLLVPSRRRRALIVVYLVGGRYRQAALFRRNSSHGLACGGCLGVPNRIYAAGEKVVDALMYRGADVDCPDGTRHRMQRHLHKSEPLVSSLGVLMMRDETDRKVGQHKTQTGASHVPGFG